MRRPNHHHNSHPVYPNSFRPLIADEVLLVGVQGAAADLHVPGAAAIKGADRAGEKGVHYNKLNKSYKTFSRLA
jgi:hypothetical protein